MKKCKTKLIEYACEILNLHSLIHRLQRIIYESDMEKVDYRNAIKTLRATKSSLKNEIVDLQRQIELRDKQIEFMKGVKKDEG